jgi:hypothetical protein
LLPLARDRRPVGGAGGRLVTGPAPAEARDARGGSSEAHSVRHVLLLQSFDRGNMTDDYTTANFRGDLGQRTGQAVNVIEIVVGPTGFVGAPEEMIVITSDRRSPIVASRTSSSRSLVPQRRLRANIESSSFPTYRSCWHRLISSICVTRRLETTRPLSRSRAIFPESSI